MAERTYYAPTGGLPGQSQLLTSRAVFTTAYAVIPKGVMTDIVTSALPFWNGARAWILSRPLSGFAETFSQYIIEIAPGGGSDRPEPDPEAEGAIFAYLPPRSGWRVRNTSAAPATFHWIRKRFQAVEGLESPSAIIANEQDIAPAAMPDTDGGWATTRMIDPADIRYDMHVNIVTFAPGAVIPFAETHVMEHGLYVLQGKGVYRLNQDWVEVEAGDFMWLRAFCPQACYAGGPEPFRYLLYKDVNRHADLSPVRAR